MSKLAAQSNGSSPFAGFRLGKVYIEIGDGKYVEGYLEKFAQPETDRIRYEDRAEFFQPQEMVVHLRARITNWDSRPLPSSVLKNRRRPVTRGTATGFMDYGTERVAKTVKVNPDRTPVPPSVLAPEETEVEPRGAKRFQSLELGEDGEGEDG
jgi:hypothetical protein